MHPGALIIHVAIRHYKLNVSHLDDDLLARINNEFAPILRSTPGFHAYRIVDTGANEIATVSFFETEEGAKASIEKAAEWVSANLAHLVDGAPTVVAGEQVFSELV